MGFRIHRGIFQKLNAERTAYENTFKIDEDGRIKEVDSEGNVTTGYLKIGEQANDADTVDGYHANNSGGGIPVLNSNGYWDAPSWINVRGTGLYSSTTNGAHFAPNGVSYGSWQITGTRNGWYGIHFGASTGVTLMMNEGESGVHREGSGWKYRHNQGKFYVHTGTNGGGTGYPVIHEGTIGSQSVASASQVSGVSVSATEMNRLKTTLGVTGLPYSCDIFVQGDPEMYYPVHFIWGDQDVWRRIIIKRGYGETAPWDPIGTGSHRGGLLLDWEGNFGGWGGATYSDRLRTFNESYTTICASMYRTTHSMGYTFFLRGGGAVYHIYSDQEIRGFHQVGTPDIAYDTNFKFYDNANAAYIVYAPAPMDRQDAERISSLRTLKRSELDSIYQPTGSYLTTSGKAADSNLLDGINSTSFLRSDADDTMSGTLTITGSNGISRLRIEGSTPTIDLDDSNGDGFYIHVNSDQFYVLADRNGIGNYGDWETPHPLQLAANTNKGYIFGSEVKSAAFQDSSAFDAAGAADAVRTDLTQLITTATDTADNAASTASTANTAATNAANAAAQAQTTADEATSLANAAQTTADSKLGATAKAADSEAVDGVDSSRIVYGANARRSTRYDGVGIVSTNQNSGFYYGNDPDGAPYTEWWNWLTVAGASWTSGNNYDFKIAHDFHSDAMYVSRMDNGTQRGWRKVWDSGNLDPANASNLSSGTVSYAVTNRVLPTSGNYVWNAATTAGNYETGVQTSFVRGADGFPHYGAVLHVGARGGGDAGGDFQLYCGHGSASGGNHLRFRNADNSASPTDSWTGWKTILDTSNVGDYALTSLPSHNHNDLYFTETEADARFLGITAKAADSNLLDGIDSVNFVYGNAKGTNDSVTTDADGLDKTGYYTAADFRTRPSSVSNWMYIEHIKLYNNNTRYQKQIGYDTYDDRMWVRTKNDNTWSSWKQVWNEGDFANNSSNWNTAYSWGNHASAGYLTSVPSEYLTQTEGDARYLGISAKAANSHAADGVNIVGYGTSEFSFHQGSGAFAGHSGWANYFIGNHGSGSSYYNTTHIMPFWGVPQYSRLEGGTFRGPWTYWTTENMSQSTVNTWNTAYGWGDHSTAGYVTSVTDALGYTPYQEGTALSTTTISATNKISLNGGHSTARVVIKYNHNGDDTSENSGNLVMWTSEPGISYPGSGIGGNIHESGHYYGKRNANIPYGVALRFNVTSGRAEFLATNSTNNGSFGVGWYVDDRGNTVQQGSITAPGYNNGNWDTAYGWGNHASAGYLTSVPNLAASKITSGTFANARISQSSVTQHQGALSIAASQVTGLPAQTPPINATVEGGEASTLASIHFSPGEGAATFTLADGQTFRLAFAR